MQKLAISIIPITFHIFKTLLHFLAHLESVVFFFFYVKKLRGISDLCNKSYFLSSAIVG